MTTQREPALGPISAVNRRSFLVGSMASLGVLGLAGCASIGNTRALRPASASIYSALPDERFPIPAADIGVVDRNYLRRVVRYRTDEEPGTIIVDPAAFYVYRVEGDGLATRYGANVGRAGFVWSGEAYIGRKAEWPIWTPTQGQLSRDPSLVQYAGGMEPGLRNPLGSRALYLYQDGRYTLYTIYGTDWAASIGTGVSSGCVGLMHQDVIHLYGRTEVGTKVIVLA